MSKQAPKKAIGYVGVGAKKEPMRGEEKRTSSGGRKEAGPAKTDETPETKEKTSMKGSPGSPGPSVTKDM